MDHVLGDGALKVPLAERNDLIETLSANGTNPSLDERVQIRAAARETTDLHSAIAEKTAKLSREERVAIEDQELCVPEEAVEGVREVPRDLHHPGLAEIGRDPGDVDTSRLELHEEQDVVTHEPMECQDLDGEEVGAEGAVPVSSEKVAPRGPTTPLGCRDNSILAEDSHDSRAGDATLLGELVTDPRVTPCLILFREAHDHVRGCLEGPWPSGATRSRSVVLLADELLEPTPKRVGTDDRGDPGQDPAVEAVGHNGQTTTLAVVQAWRLPAKELLENGVLGPEIFDQVLLLAVDPPGAEDNEELNPRRKPTRRHARAPSRPARD